MAPYGGKLASEHRDDWERLARHPGRSRRKRAAGRRGSLSFLARWILAIFVAMVLAGIVEYAFAAQQITDRALDDSLKSYQAQVHALEAELAEAMTPVQRAAAIESHLHQIEESYGTLYVGLFDTAGRRIAGTAASAGASKLADADWLSEVVSTGSATVHSEDDEGEGGPAARYEYLLPVQTPGGLLILEVDQRAGIVTELIADLRQRKALALLLSVLIAIPLSYLFGGRALHRRQLRSDRDADTDALTGLAGRRPFRPALEAALADKADATVTLALIDLDGFKQINDRLGHSHGDRILIGLADSFDGLRATDTAFRLGGDEFAVLLPGSDDAQAIDAIARVRAALTARFPGVTFSCGIASRPAGEPLVLQELWERSDAALYEAKHLGRRQTVSFASMTDGHTVSAEKLDAVKALIAPESPITVAFQPIWDLRRGVVLAHEALLRLPEGTPIDGPQEAFELAQRLGVAAALDARARTAVLAAVHGRDWQGLLFINVHPDALPGLDIDVLVTDLAAVGLEPADVVLEVTEQAGLDHPEPIRVLKHAHRAGFRLALDDMGQSNAGLRALTLVQFDVVKLDRSVVARLGSHPAAAATVAAATTFVQQTGGWIIAEGIEDTAMLNALLHPPLTEAGRETVLAGQGYLLGRPQHTPLALDERASVLDGRPLPDSARA